jgi:Tfp pilus assembly protein PilN
VKAVNLIPSDLRRRSGGIGRSGGAVYVLLGGLAGLLLLGTLYAVANHQVADRKAQLVKATQDSAVAQARAGQLAPYKQFADFRNTREQSITSLAASRFDWPTAMRNLASALPSDVVLSTFAGSPGGTSGPGAAPSAAPAAGGAPSVHLTGCASTHTQVGDVINRLRGVPGVTGVSFTSSAKGSGTGGSTGGSCGSGGPQFDLSVAFAAGGSATTSAAPGSAQPTSAPTPAATSPAASSPTPAAPAPTTGTTSTTPAAGGGHP